jgi:uncharacterized protein with PIN domain
MMGHDVEYCNNTSDFELLSIARQQQRDLLTRDFELYQRANAKLTNAYYVQGRTEEERLAELATRFGLILRIDMAGSRCPKCNTHIKPALKKDIALRVEKNTFENYTEFWECPKCSQVYWQGAHWKQIREMLTAAIGIQEQKK